MAKLKLSPRIRKKNISIKTLVILILNLVKIDCAEAQDSINLESQNVKNFYNVENDFFVITHDSLNIIDTLFNVPETSYRGLFFDDVNNCFFTICKVEAWWYGHNIFIIEQYKIESGIEKLSSYVINEQNTFKNIGSLNIELREEHIFLYWQKNCIEFQKEISYRLLFNFDLEEINNSSIRDNINSLCEDRIIEIIEGD